ncbi:MAG: hypothetical protein ACOYYS_22005 [Chloroflexota bacterium]
MLLRLFAGICLFGSCVLLAWAYWPLPVQEARLSLALPAVAEGPVIVRQATLTFPARLRLGEAATLRLSFTPTGDEPAFDGYSLLADATLEMPALHIRSASRQQLALIANRPVHFDWEVVAPDTGEVQGIVPLKVHVYFQDERPAEEVLLSAQPCQINVSSLFDLPVVFVRLLGALGGIGAFFLFLAAPHLKDYGSSGKSGRAKII